MATSPLRNALALGGALALGALGGTAITAVADDRRLALEHYEQLDFFARVYDIVQKHYATDVDDETALRAAAQGMLRSLDRHSGYLPPEAFEALEEANRGQFGGLGIEVLMEGDFIKVVTPIEGTPADAAGLRPNDLISHVDGEPLQGKSQTEAIEQLKGEPGTDVTITVLREETEPFDVTITRDIITVHPVTAEARGDVGWVRIRTFSQLTTEELTAELKRLKTEIGDPIGYVIDVRSNPGGLLNEAISVSDVFLDDGEIVSTRGRRASETSREFAKRGDLTDGKPIVVLINGGSASASEIVAGALKDRGRATLVGEKSFGKGSVQTVLPIRTSAGRPNGAVRLTTARYYTPSGQSIHEKGIEPDVEAILIPEGEEIRPDFRFGDADDRQLDKAIEVLREIAAGEDYAAARADGR